MPVTVNTLNHDNFRHSVNINNHELFTDLPKSLGGDDSAPSPHDYFDAALASCKALTVIVDIHAVAEVVVVERIDGNGHGKPHKKGRMKVMQL